MGKGVIVRSNCRWCGEATFEHVPTSGAAFVSDAPLMGEEPRALRGPTPMEMLLGALCGCSGADLVGIFEKMRLKIRTLTMEVEGERGEEHPRIFREIVISYRIETDPPDAAKALRAVELSMHKYCAVSATLASAGRVRYRLSSAGEEFEGEVPVGGEQAPS